MFFSVIIPLYNKAAYVKKTVESVLCQTFKDYELIVIDDGSTDDSAEVVEKMIEENTELAALKAAGRFVFIRQQNSGVSAARNHGIKESKGDYLCFLDADDWWEPSFLSSIVFLSEKYPSVSVLGTGRYNVKYGKKNAMFVGLPENIVHGLVEYEYVIEKYGCRPIQTSSVAVKRSVLHNIDMFNPTFKFGEDFDFFYRAYLNGGLALYNSPCSNFNQDVDLQTRGSRPMSLYKKEQSAFFNMDYVFLHNTKTVRHFTEYLKLKAFYFYYIQGLYKDEINAQLADVCWREHPLRQFMRYKVLPVRMQWAWFKLRVQLSKIKKRLLH